MTTVTIKELPEDLYRRLREQAARNRRSISAEAIVCLQRSLGVAAVDPEAFLADVALLRERSTEFYVTDESIREARRRGRP